MAKARTSRVPRIFGGNKCSSIKVKNFTPFPRLRNKFPVVCDATIRLWIRDGYKGVKLECVRIGGRRYVAAGTKQLCYW